jgi:hypothetical protein
MIPQVVALNFCFSCMHEQGMRGVPQVSLRRGESDWIQIRTRGVQECNAVAACVWSCAQHAQKLLPIAVGLCMSASMIRATNLIVKNE